jgi:DNA-binding NtrC family response regulator
VQAKLLRALQEQEIEPLGADRVVKVDVRVIAATGRDLKTLVEQGQFRSDLYYRLNVLPIALPPLRERTADLEALCDLLLEGVATATGQPQRDIHPGAMALLRAYDWPGNVRELRNVLERACVLSEGRVVTREDVARILPPLSGRPRGAQTPAELRPLAEMVAEVERAAIEAALAASRGKKAPAAKLLGISRSNLYEKLSDLGILSEERT